MIYFKMEMMKFPKHFNQNPTKMKLINELTNNEIEVEVEDLSVNPHFYEFDLTDIELTNGTYRYELGKEVGLLQVGDYVAVATEYNEKKNNIEYVR